MAHSAEQEQGRSQRRRELLHLPVLQPNEHRVRVRLRLRLRRQQAGQLHPPRQLQRKNFPAKTRRKIRSNDNRPVFGHQLCPGVNLIKLFFLRQ